MVVFSSMAVPTSGSAYDPATDRWRQLASPPGQLLIPVQRVAWTGREVIVVLWPAKPSNGPNSDMFLASYSPASDQWSLLPEVDLKDGFSPPLVWTGREVLVLQSSGPGHAFDPVRQTWRRLASGMDDPPTFAASPVWTGRQVLLWAGGEHGFAYDPATDSWSTFDAGGLGRRSDAIVAWADGLLVGWGGADKADGIPPPPVGLTAPYPRSSRPAPPTAPSRRGPPGAMGRRRPSRLTRFQIGSPTTGLK